MVGGAVLSHVARRLACARASLALQLKEVIAARAKANMSRGGQGYQKSDNPVHTLKELSAAANVSHDTMHKVEVVERDAPKPSAKS